MGEGGQILLAGSLGLARVGCYRRKGKVGPRMQCLEKVGENRVQLTEE